MNRPFTLPALVSVLLALSVAAQDGPVEQAKKARADKNHERAAAILKEAWDDIKEDKEAVLMFADSALQAGQLDQASWCADKVTQMAPDTVEAYRIGAQANLWLAEQTKTEPDATEVQVNGYYEIARNLAIEGLRHKADDRELLRLKGEAQYWLQQFSESAAAFEKLLDLKPGDAAAQVALARSLAQAGTDEAASRAAELYGKALKSRDLSDDMAGEAANGVWNTLGSRQRFDQAVDLMRAWSEAHPDSVVALWWTGYYEFCRKKYDKAEELFAKAWKKQGESYASAAFQAGRAAWAQAAASESGNLDYSKADVKKLEDAVRWFARAWKTGTWTDRANDPVAQIWNLFLGLANAQRLDEGAKLVEEVALPAAPDDWRLLNILGLYYRDESGNRGGSEGRRLARKSAEYYERASRSVLQDDQADGPQRAQILNDTGVVFHFPQYHIEDVEKGKSYYEKALQSDPSYTDANENLGLVYNKLGRYEDAIPHFERVLRQQPNRPVSLRGLREAKSHVK